LLRATCERCDRDLFAAALRACAASESPIFADEKIFVEKASAPHRRSPKPGFATRIAISDSLTEALRPDE
jgi:hypothetical protein